jgi:hypothetical protein
MLHSTQKALHILHETMHLNTSALWHAVPVYHDMLQRYNGDHARATQAMRDMGLEAMIPLWAASAAERPADESSSERSNARMPAQPMYGAPQQQQQHTFGDSAEMEQGHYVMPSYSPKERDGIPGHMAEPSVCLHTSLYLQGS